jgi:hypothetical protein
MHALIICLLIAVSAAHEFDTIYSPGETLEPLDRIRYSCDTVGRLHATDMQTYEEVAGFPVLLEAWMYFEYSPPVVTKDTVIVATSDLSPAKLFFVDIKTATLLGKWEEAPDPNALRRADTFLTYMESRRLVIFSCTYWHNRDSKDVWVHIYLINMDSRELINALYVPLRCEGEQLRNNPYCRREREFEVPTYHNNTVF